MPSAQPQPLHLVHPMALPRPTLRLEHRMPKPTMPRSQRLPRTITPELIRAALACIAPDVDRDTWARVGMAIKSEAPGDTGFALWDEWSAQGDTYEAKYARDTWRSIKGGGKTTIGTLFGIASDHGFKFPAVGPGQTPGQAAQVQRLAQERHAQREAEAAELARQHEDAAQRCARLWDGAATAPPEAGATYLKRKGVQAFGLRFLGGVAVVPMRDEAGRLWSVQRLLPKRLKDAASGKDGTDKLFGPIKCTPDEVVHSRKTGLFHAIGQVDGATVLLLAEGYATAASLHEATGRPVVVCFDSGNLVHVARALRQQWPALPLLVCGDDDRATEAKGRPNAGKLKAQAAAELTGQAQGLAAMVLPVGLPDGPDGGSDFNDLAARSGLPAVAAQVEAAAVDLLARAAELARQRPESGAGAAISTTDDAVQPPGPGAAPGGLQGVMPAEARAVADGAGADAAAIIGASGPVLRLVPGGLSSAEAAPAPAAADSTGPAGGGRGGKGGRKRSGGGGDGTDADDDKPRDPFSVDDAGVWFAGVDSDGSTKPRQWVCSRLEVTARTRTDDHNGWGCLLEFSDPDGHPKTWAMPSAMLSGDGGEWAARLRDMGLRMAPGTLARNLVARYIDTRRPDARVTCTDRVGWHGPVYVLPASCITPADAADPADGDEAAASAEAGGDRQAATLEPAPRRYVFQSDSGMEDTFRRMGELADWRSSVAALAVGNSRLVFAIAVAFAGPLVRPAGVESGGFHFRGISSQGKTSALKVAASVWGRPTFMQRWRTTDNALEAIAAQHCDCTLILDEFGQLDPKVAGECAYMLANEQEKGRATRGAMLRKRRTWRLLFLSSGEVSLSDHMAEAGKRTRAGMEVRMLDVPLDAGQGMGGIELLNGHEGPAALADAIVTAAARHYGTAGRAWLQWCADYYAELPELVVELVERIRADLVPEAAAEQVRRAGTRFALVAAAGELATRAGITGWTKGEATQAVRQCFNAWLAARGHIDNGENAAMMRQVRQFLELHGEGRFAWWHRAMDDHNPKTLNRAGFRRLLGEDGKPVKSNADHLREYGERMTPTDAAAAKVDYIVLRDVFEHEVCRGFDPRAVAKLLKARDHLETEDGGRLTDRQRLPGMGGEKVPCYHLRPSIFTDEL